jgi:hypothetical protein
VTLKLLRITKSAMEEDETLFVLLPTIDVLEIIQAIVEYKWEVLLLNLALFLANQMTYNRWTMEALTVILHWGYHPKMEGSAIVDYWWYHLLAEEVK